VAGIAHFFACVKSRLLRLTPAGFFLAVSIPLTVAYACTFSNLTDYPHGPQRFLHVVHLAHEVYGDPERLPVSFLELTYQTAPHMIHTISANACHWRAALRKRYCPKKPLPFLEMDSAYGKLSAIALEPDNTFIFHPAAAAAHFPALGYIFYTVGALVGLLLQLSPIAIMYLSIAANAVAVIGLGVLCLRLLPAMRWPACFLLLIPASSINRIYIMPDTLMFTLVLLILALTIRLCTHPRFLKAAHIAGLAALSIAVCITKFAYFLIPFIYLIIPARCFKNMRMKYVVLGGIIVCCIVTSMGWGMYVAKAYYHSDLAADTSPVSRKLIPILQSPITYIESVVIETANRLRPFTTNLLTWNQGDWMSTHNLHPFWFIAPLLLLVLFEAPLPYESQSAERTARLLGVAIFFGTIVLVFISIFLHTGSLLVLQGRHFMPALPFLLLSLHGIIPWPPVFRSKIAPFIVAYALGSILILNAMELAQ
jgi:uncharacterized membrane protein